MPAQVQERVPLIKRLHSSLAAQFFFLVITLLYVLSPIDLIPDITPVIGWIDDLGLFLAELIQFMVYLKKKRESISKTLDGNKSTNSGESK